MIFREKLAIEINSHNIDMLTVGYGSRPVGKIPMMLSVLGQVEAEPQYKNLFVCMVHSVKDNIIMPDVKTESVIYEDNFAKYMDRILHQRSRNYFIVPKDLEQDELKMLNSVAIYSNLDERKKTEKYYTDLLDCSRIKFKDRYRTTLELFCKLIDDKLHAIEMRARKLI